MTLAEFRQSRHIVPIETALQECPHIADLDIDSNFTYAALYSGDCFILQSRRGWYLLCEGDEYESRDLAALEFLLWLWLVPGGQAETMRRMIWESDNG